MWHPDAMWWLHVWRLPLPEKKGKNAAVLALSR